MPETTETTVADELQVVQPQAETPPEPAVEPAAEPTPTDAPPPAAEPAPKPAAANEPDWREQRLAKQSARMAEMRAELERLKAEREGTGEANLTEAEVEARAQAKAEQIAEQRRFVESCNELAKVGSKEFPDFNSKITDLQRLVDKDDPSSIARYNEMLQAVLATENGHEVLYRLGSDLNKASQVLNLSGARMGVELARLGATAGEAGNVTSAPPPIKPIASKGQTRAEIRPDDPERADELDKYAWFARRQKQVEQRARR